MKIRARIAVLQTCRKYFDIVTGSGLQIFAVEQAELPDIMDKVFGEKHRTKIIKLFEIARLLTHPVIASLDHPLYGKP
jgi:hypothetical protein